MKNSCEKPLSRMQFVAGITAIFSVFLSGCGSFIKTNYSGISLDIPPHWIESDTVVSPYESVTKSWWARFDDPQLDALIAKVLGNNNTLSAASLSLHQASLEYDLVGTNRTPTVAFDVEGGVTRELKSGAQSSRMYTSSATVSYELDFWGRLKRLRDASGWELEATEYDKRAAALALVGSATRLYWNIAALNSQISITQESIETARLTSELVSFQRAAGRASEFDEVQSRSALQSLLGDLPRLKAQLEAARNSLAILSNQAPSKREPELVALPLVDLPALPRLLPANLLGNRPDLLASESRVRKLLEQADAARVEFYPTISLNFLLQTSGLTAANLFQNPVGTIGGVIALPFLQWNTADLKIRSTRAAFDISIVNFRQSFYQALADTQSAISASTQSAEEVRQRRSALIDARKAEELAEIRFRAGRTDVKEWLNLQRTRQQAAVGLEQALLLMYTNEITLYLALGGDPWAQGLNR